MFMKHQEVDATNNLAKRDLRRIVLLRKKSYGTLRKSGRNVFDFLTQLLESFFKGIAGAAI